jgi:hypothetical protein
VLVIREAQTKAVSGSDDAIRVCHEVHGGVGRQAIEQHGGLGRHDGEGRLEHRVHHRDRRINERGIGRADLSWVSGGAICSGMNPVVAVQVPRQLPSRTSTALMKSPSALSRFCPLAPRRSVMS